MAAGKLKLIIKQGATFRRPLWWKTGEDMTAVDLTGWKALLQARKKAGEPGLPLLELTTENGGITITPTEGKIELYLSDEATALIQWKEADYGLFMLAPNGDTISLVEGKIEFQMSVPVVPAP